jgi:electron transport complex protein RnfC
MRTVTFKGGVHPLYRKDISIREPLRKAPFPETAVVPLSQHIGAPDRAVVRKGDHVTTGQPVGRSDSYVSSIIHAPVSGEVLGIKRAFHPVMGPTDAVYIKPDAEQEPLETEEQDTAGLSKEELIEKIRDAGIVGMGGAAFPTHVKLNVPEGKKIDTLIINGAECEPFLTCDHIIMTKKTEEVLKGIGILNRILSPEKIYIAIEDNKKASLFAFQKALREAGYRHPRNIEMAALETKYPQGGEKQLIKAITGKEVPPGGLPMDVGCLVQNVGTLFAVYEAVYYEKPLIERVITISGDCMYRPGNYLVRIGTTLRDIAEKFKIELFKRPAKIITGGPMMGISEPHLDVPVIKSTSGVLFLSEETALSFEEGPCIKCAKCVDVCPVGLSPTEIMRQVRARKWDKAEDLFAQDCMECGSCAYICPARIPLVQYIKQGKNEVISKKRKA